MKIGLIVIVLALFVAPNASPQDPTGMPGPSGIPIQLALSQDECRLVYLDAAGAHVTDYHSSVFLDIAALVSSDYLNVAADACNPETIARVGDLVQRAENEREALRAADRKKKLDALHAILSPR